MQRIAKKTFTRKRLLWILTPLLVLAVAAGVAFYWMLSGTSAAPLALQARTSVSTASAAKDLSGTWSVVAGPGDEATTAGYRVVEKVAGGIATDTATGRTGHVQGSVTVAGKQVTAADFTVEMTTLKSDKSLRDSVLKTVAIQTSKYPTASFTLTQPIVLADPAPGKIEHVNARGTLRLHGVSRSVSVALQYQETETGFRVLADMPIAMADFAIKAPSIGGVVSVQNHGTFEVLVNLAK
ncbi:MAG TPA: YceI family protein [Frankiaceae bacterium]|jgi:polyisoprenoid-binding protein YceI|nr:YceI family protein [Frankiaceae bacterium]